MGELDRGNLQRSGNLLNPIDCFRVGMGQILAGPLHLLRMFGLLGASVVYSVQRSSVFKAFTGLIALIGAVAAVFGLIVDLPQAIPTIKEWLGAG